MLMPSRTYTSVSYRAGFNGMEKDDEMKGGGNSYDFGARIYDPRLGRWMSTDPLEKLLKGWTPYRFGLDNPIKYSDSEGKFEIDEATRKAYPNFSAYIDKISEVYADKPEEFKKAFKQYSQLSDEEVKEMLTKGKGPKIIVEEM